MLDRQSPHSWGLMGMQERISLLDGDFRIDSSPNVGTKITISIPYRPQDKKLHTSNEGMTNDN
jgi:glucose-6-phosphate-specific signal transduction histidine kinase